MTEPRDRIRARVRDVHTRRAEPTPAIDAASIMKPRASTSAPEATARRRYRPPYSSALHDHTSATGLAP
jgi:hypothetical protein